MLCDCISGCRVVAAFTCHFPALIKTKRESLKALPGLLRPENHDILTVDCFPLAHTLGISAGDTTYQFLHLLQLSFGTLTKTCYVPVNQIPTAPRGVRWGLGRNVQILLHFYTKFLTKSIWTIHTGCMLTGMIHSMQDQGGFTQEQDLSCGDGLRPLNIGILPSPCISSFIALLHLIHRNHSGHSTKTTHDTVQVSLVMQPCETTYLPSLHA